jgi:DUF1365 family protein
VSRALCTHLLAGTVRHRRARHANYEFTHSAWYLALDVDEVDEVLRRSRLLSRRRWRPLRLDDRDHVTMPGLDFAASVRARLLAAGYPAQAWRLTLIAYPRVLGHVFNPVSFVLAHDEEGTLRHVVAEVHNTHGEREVYDFTPEASGPAFRSSALKRMYVSPFIGAAARYDLAVAEAGDRLSIAIREVEADRADEAGRETLYAGVTLRARPFSDRELLRLLARDPVVPLKTVVLIGWHAFRLWRRGVRWERFRPRTYPR